MWPSKSSVIKLLTAPSRRTNDLQDFGAIASLIQKRVPTPQIAVLGYYLLRTGRRTNSLILEADGKHVLTDSWTSFGVVVGLGLVLLTHWKPFNPMVAIAVAVNILWSGDAWSGARLSDCWIILIRKPVEKFGTS